MRSPLTWSHSKIEKGRNKDISLKKAHRISGVRARDACRLARQWVRRSTKALRPLHQPPHTHSIQIYSNSLGGADPDNDFETTQGPNLSTDQSDPDLLSNTKRSPNVGLMLGQRRRRWANIKTLRGHLVFFNGGHPTEVDATLQRCNIHIWMIWRNSLWIELKMCAIQIGLTSMVFTLNAVLRLHIWH